MDVKDDLFEAVESGTASEVKAALSAGADPGGARTGFGETPLHTAAWRNSNPSVITALIEAGADPVARDLDGDTPLHWAALFNSNPSVITALIEGGADPAARDYDGKVPFDRLKENDAFEALRETDAYRLLNEARFE